MPSPGQLAPTRWMAKRIRTQKPPTRLPFETDDPTTGARHEYQHRWPLWQPNQTANLPARATSRVNERSTHRRCEGCCTTTASDSHLTGHERMIWTPSATTASVCQLESV